MAIKKGNNEQSILLNVSTNTDDAVKDIQALEAELNKLKDLKINASGEDLVKITNQIKDVESAISKANSNKITPKADNKEVKNTILSLHEMEDLLNHLRDEQKATKDPLKLKELSKQAGELELKIRDINEPFRDVNREIGELEDRLYAMSAGGQANTAEFGEMVLKVAELKKVVIDIDSAVDAISVDKFGVFLGVGEQMVGVFGGVTSTLQLMGVDASKAEEQIAKLMQLQGIMQGLQSLNQFRKQWTVLLSSFKGAKVATDSINTISTATDGLTSSTVATTTATKGATLATRVFSVALKAIGIGLLVSALAYLVANFDKLKEYVLKLFPVLNTLAGWFSKITDAVTDFVGVTSDATRALDKLEKSTLTRNEGIKRQIELLEAQGNKEKEIYKLQQDLTNNSIRVLNEKAKVNKKLTEEEQQQLIDLYQEKNILYLNDKKRLTEEAKEANDKAKERGDNYREQLKQLKNYLKESEKVTYSSNHSQRQIELSTIKDKYKEQIDLAKKLKQDYSKLEMALSIESNAVNKKYDNEYFNFIKSNGQQFLDSFSAEYLGTIESYNSQKVNGTEEQKKELDERLNNQLIYLSKLKQLQITLKNAENDLNSADNTINDSDTFSIQKTKLDNQLQAEKEYNEISLYQLIESKKLENGELERLYFENQERLKELQLDPETNVNEISNIHALMNAKLSAVEANNTAIEEATTAHNRKLKKAEEDNSKAKQKISKQETKNRIEELNIYGDAIGDVSDLLTEGTVVQKGLAVSSSLINTYSAIAGQLKAFSGVPIPGYAIAQAIATGAVGFANVAKILSVKVPNASDGDNSSGGNSTSAPSFSAPIINSTILRSNENGNDEIKTAIESNNTENQVVKAYITNSDLKSNDEKNSFISSISTY